MQYNVRSLSLKDIERKSLFLFGPRQTGKSLLIAHLFPKAPTYNLLLSDVYLKFTKNPSLFRQEVLALDPKNCGPIVVDEIQKIPLLLDEIHYLIELKNYKFILTGSSARKLKHGASNLLGGRALEKKLFPLIYQEIPNYDLLKILNFGALPSIYHSPDPEEDLLSYVGTYLKEEVQAEGLVRGIQQFSDFLEKAALSNGELLNFANVASDLGVSSKTVSEYFLILQDTLIGNLLKPFNHTKKRKAISKAKFYYFDIGVTNILAKRFRVEEESEVYGKCLEHLIHNEITAYLSYQKDRRELTFWRSVNGQEVDFIIGKDVAIEVKSSKTINAKHLKGLNALSEEIKFKRKIVISREDQKRILENNIEVYPVLSFLKALWNNEF